MAGGSGQPRLLAFQLENPGVRVEASGWVTLWMPSSFFAISNFLFSMERRTFLKITLPVVATGRAVAASEATPATEPDLVFGVIADPQYADADMRMNRYYRNSLSKLEAAVGELNQHPLEFTVTLGDLIDRDLASFDAVMPIYAKLKHPHHPVCGNHDFSVADEDKTKVLPAMGLEQPYYAKERKSWRFLFLDGTDIGVWRYPAADPRTATAKAMLEAGRKAKKPNFARHSAAIGPKQMGWIAAELEAARKADQRVILFSHYPLLPVGNNHNLWNAPELVELLDQNPHAVGYMNGHNHKGNYAQQGSCHYLNFKGMVETEKETAYAVVKCFADRLEIEGYGLEPDKNLGGI